MKTNLLKSIFISLILLVGATNAWSATITSDGTARLYFKMDAISWWVVQAKEGANFAYFFNSSSNAWSTKAVQYSGQQYYVVIPKGSWTTVILTRNGSQNSPSWDNKFNQTGNITLSSTSNYISKFSEGSTSVTWGTAVKPASTGSLSASSTSVNIGANVTLTPSLTSNQTINDIKSTTYSISPNSGASTSNNTFTATKAGTYTVTATITYNPDGYTSITSTATATATITVNPWTITWNPNGGSVTPTSSTYDGATAVSLPTPTRTGYNSDGWYTAASGGTKINDIGTTTKPTTNVTYYAHWTPKTYAITLNANGGASNGSATATYNSSTITNLTHPNRTDYRCNGYYTATSGGTLVLNIDGTLAKNVSGYTDSNGNWTKDGDATLHAQWTYDVTVYTVTFGVGTGSTSYGSLSAKNNSTSETITSPATVRSGQNITFTANPKTGYVVEGWYTNAACTADKHGAGQTTYTTSITGITNVYVKFVEKTWSVAFAAGTGGSVTTPSSTPQTVGQITGISIAATPAPGYTFKQWTITSGSGSFTSAATTNSNKFKPTANSTVTASFTENLYAITVKSSDNNHGTVTQSTDKAGIATTIAITATPVLGYRFVNWTATNGITIADANSTTTTITASATGTVTANFELIPPTTIYIRSNGSYADFKWNYNSVAYGMTPMDCAGTYYTANILGGVNEITLTGSNNFTTTTLTVPQDDNVLYDLTSTNITHLYLKPHANWTQASARFAVYFFGSNGNAWQSMTAVGESGYYEAAIPAGSWTGVIFCRMNPSSSTNGWTQNTQLWNQTADLQFPTNGNNLYTLTGGTWSDVTGSWSAHYDNSRWTTFEAPTLDVKVNITGKGSIVLNGETYTSDSPGTTSFTISKAINEKITVGDITPAERWVYNNDAKIEMCDEEKDLATSHTITGPAAISLSFKQVSCEVVFNLNLPKGVIIPSWSIANQTVAMDGTATEPTSVGEIGEYLFGGWYTNGSTFTNANKYDFNTPVTKDLTLYARWIPYAQCIFFKNTLGWKDVYVYTFSDNAWWNDGTGVHPGTNKLEQGQMTKIGQTDVYYYILTDLTGFSHIAFSDFDMRTYGLFNDHKAIYRSDRSDQLQLFIPQTDQKPTTVQYSTNQYYSSGIWMKYNSTESGYKWSSDKNGWSTDVNPFTASAKGGYTFTTTVSLSGNTKYLFKVNNIRGDWYSKVCTITQDECTNLWFQPESDPNKNAIIQPNVTGDYIFTINLGNGKVELSLEYPLSVGDYRLSYYDAKTGFHPGHYIKKRNEDRRDIVSFFVHIENDPEIRLEHCTAIDANTSTATWEILDQYKVLKTSGADPTSAQLPDKRKSDAVLYTGEGCGIETSGVYNFILKQSGNDAELATDLTHAYVGDFYIRTDAAEGGWDSFRQKSNQITYSSFADKHSNFNHYYCKYIDAGRNVKFTIANDYSYCISDTLDKDDIIKEGQSSLGCLPISANVRFGWDSNTNEISRAYIKGAGMTSDRFLVLQGKDNNLKDANGNVIPKGTGTRTGLEANEEILVDQENWIYQVDVTANNNTFIKLVADYNKTTQYFKGDAKEYTRLLSSTASKNYKIRLVYDFKSNHLVTAWLAGGNTVEGEQVLGADMMVIRKDQGQADQLNFTPTSSSLGDVGIGYAVMKFTKAHLENLEEDNETPLPKNEEKTERERSLYWVSFPFDVKVSDVFGFGEYAEHWILQYYDGAERAEKGLFSDSGTYWKYIFDTDTKLKAGEGYVLVLDLNKIEFLYGATEVSLYFPSTNPLTTISGELSTPATVPEYWCNIDREWTGNGTTYHHKYTDSHWNLIGVPGFADITGFDVTQYSFMQKEASFYYNFSLENSRYNVESSNSTSFNAMYAYMVQFAGTINWVSKKVNAAKEPQELAARRNSESELPEKVVLGLELVQGEEKADQTFVQLQQEGATANFDLSLDLTKIMNSGFSNIYTLTDSLKIQVAGNALPMEETVVPVGVNIAAAGEYTFRMPDGTGGMVVELIDYYTNTRTNLLLFDYTVTLPKGSNEGRFALHIQPSKSGVTTNIDQINGGSMHHEGVQKYLIDGQLYIVREGVVYDAQGHRL